MKQKIVALAILEMFVLAGCSSAEPTVVESQESDVVTEAVSNEVAEEISEESNPEESISEEIVVEMEEDITDEDSNVDDEEIKQEMKQDMLDYEKENGAEEILGDSTATVEEKSYLLITNGCYETALDLLEGSRDELSAKGWINFGYLYSEGLTSEDVDIEMADFCYDEAACEEAEYNRLYMHLKYQVDGYDEMLRGYIERGDEVVENYLDQSVPDFGYFEEGRAYSEDGIEMPYETIEESLYEWEFTAQYYKGFNPPNNTSVTRWISQGIDYEGTSPYVIYREQRRNLGRGAYELEKYYAGN